LETPKWDGTADLWEDLCAASQDSAADPRGKP
jgi:hypothetical protein